MIDFIKNEGKCTQLLSFVDMPNTPSGPLKLAVVDGRVTGSIEKRLLGEGVQLIKTKRYTGLYDAVSFHPDMMLHHIGENRIVFAPNTDTAVLQELESHGFILVPGGRKLNPAYPDDIAYNGARVGRYFLHNLKYTDEIILKELTAAGVELINVKQGYAKCSVAVINENAIITADVSIAKEASRRNIRVLQIPPQKNIKLPGLDYGFIGGCSGLIGKGRWAVFGKAGNLASFHQIREFLNGEDCKIVSLSEDEVIDFGSLLTLKT